MNENQNMPSGVVVNRQTQTQTVVPDSSYEDLPDGLPFYYTMDMRLCIMMIILGIILGIAQLIITIGLILLPFLRKEYRCIRCKTKFIKLSKPEKCPLCGGIVIPEKEYIENQTPSKHIN